MTVLKPKPFYRSAAGYGNPSRPVQVALSSIEYNKPLQPQYQPQPPPSANLIAPDWIQDRRPPEPQPPPRPTPIAPDWIEDRRPPEPQPPPRPTAITPDWIEDRRPPDPQPPPRLTPIAPDWIEERQPPEQNRQLDPCWEDHVARAYDDEPRSNELREGRRYRAHQVGSNWSHCSVNTDL